MIRELQLQVLYHIVFVFFLIGLCNYDYLGTFLYSLMTVGVFGIILW